MPRKLGVLACQLAREISELVVERDKLLLHEGQIGAVGGAEKQGGISKLEARDLVRDQDSISCREVHQPDLFLSGLFARTEAAVEIHGQRGGGHADERSPKHFVRVLVRCRDPVLGIEDHGQHRCVVPQVLAAGLVQSGFELWEEHLLDCSRPD